jgi:carboxymethylenebutenolidase
VASETVELREHTVQVGGSAMTVLTAYPTGSGRHPAVLVLHHRGGLDAFTRCVLERLAGIGLVAAAPDNYHRRPPGEDPVASMKYLVDGELVADMDAAIDDLIADSRVRRDRIGLVGHCLGGRTGYLGLGTNPIYQAAVILYHGDLFVARDPAMPPPIAFTDQIRCPIAGFFGNRDTNPSPEAVSRLEAELQRCAIRYEFHRYDDAGHAFQDYTSPNNYAEGPARDAWTGLLEFLNRELISNVMKETTK